LEIEIGCCYDGVYCALQLGEFVLNALVRLFLDICLLKRGPQDIPASPFLFQGMLVTYFAANLILNVISGIDLIPALMSSAAELLLLLLSIWVVLSLAKYRSRFTQTAIAMMGTLLIFSVISVLLYVWLEHAVTEAEKQGLLVSSVVLWIWTISVGGHIFRHALNTVFFVGFLVSFVNMSILIEILSAL